MNRGLTRATGYELRKQRAEPRARRRRRAGQPATGCVEAPVFVMCTCAPARRCCACCSTATRGSTRRTSCTCATSPCSSTRSGRERSMAELGLDTRRAEYLLWDRLLQRELAASGKEIIVNKTPNNVFIVDRLRECWPDARFIYLLRHPGAIARSRQQCAARTPTTRAQRRMVLRYGKAIEAARQTYDGPHRPLRGPDGGPRARDARLCAFLGVPWEPGMLEYGQFDHGRFKAGLGDWGERSSPARSSRPSRRRRPRRSTPRCASLRRMGLRAAPAGAACDLSRVTSRRSPSSCPSSIPARTSTTASRRCSARRCRAERVRGDLRRRRLDRRDPGAAGRARGRASRTSASCTSRTRAGPAGRATSASTWRAASTSCSSTTTTGSARRRSSGCTRRAERDEADIVIGKVVGARASRRRAACSARPPRRRRSMGAAARGCSRRTSCSAGRFLDEHGIRFPEGRRRLEDHVFVMQAYFQAQRISVLADYPCYHWVHARRRARNASYAALEPARLLRQRARGARHRSTSTWSPGRCATACARTGTAARCSAASAARTS